MTAYANYVGDLSSRSRRLLALFGEAAEREDLEVTLLLAIATPCFLIPYERLEAKDAVPNWGGSVHPSRDAKLYADACKRLDYKLRSDCRRSGLWPDGEAEEWGYLEAKNVDGAPDSWLESTIEPIERKATREVLTILRNALAHGNIWTSGNPIGKLVFLTRRSFDSPQGPFDVLLCTPDALRRLLQHWADYLEALPFPAAAFVETNTLRRDHAAA